MKIMSLIICIIILGLVGLIAWIEITRGIKSSYGKCTFNDDLAPEEVKIVIEKVKIEKQLDGYKLLSLLKKKYGFDNYSITPFKGSSKSEPQARTKFSCKFLVNTYFQENMTIRIYQDCIHEIQHAKDRMLLIKYIILFWIAFFITISAFILNESWLLFVGAYFWIDATYRNVIIERNAIQFAADECFGITQDLGFSKKECTEVSSYLNNKSKNIQVWYKWFNIEKNAILALSSLIIGICLAGMLFALRA